MLISFMGWGDNLCFLGMSHQDSDIYGYLLLISFKVKLSSRNLWSDQPPPLPLRIVYYHCIKRWEICSNQRSDPVNAERRQTFFDLSWQMNELRLLRKASKGAPRRAFDVNASEGDSVLKLCFHTRGHFAVAGFKSWIYCWKDVLWSLPWIFITSSSAAAAQMAARATSKEQGSSAF